MKKEEFYAALSARGCELSPKQKEQLHRFYQLLVEWNARMNLTGITEEEEVYAKHFYDSLDPFLDMDLSTVKTCCDVGTGAGFPGMPLAIVYPDIQFELIDSLKKRIDFLNHCARELELRNVEAVHIRAEDLAVQKREQFDLVTSRAVARLPILAELCGALVRVGGWFVTLKGPAGHDELIEAKEGPKKLGLMHRQTKEASLAEVGERVNLYFEKTSATPKKYPRAFGQMKKKPLI